MITPDQIRAARALLRLDQAEVARRAEVSLATLRRVERGCDKPRPSAQAVASIRHALESAGAEFIDHGVKRRLAARTPEEKETMFRDLMAIAKRSAEFAAKHPGGFSEDDLYDENGLPA
jgi:transcriptional regulator with XRE-family HTH domain